ncbi:MAG: hypothetical protein N3F03_05420 [Ignavibacteria bacterium]|nr:hypothetical protein [Ignavibacteria bacterium]
MSYLFEDDYILFEKIRRKKERLEREDAEKKFNQKQLELLYSQVFGSIHCIEEIKIPWFFRKKDYYYKIKSRPGAVIIPPSKETNYETQWSPMTTKIQNRDPRETVFLLRGVEQVVQDSALLLTYRWWYKFTSLSERVGKLSERKKMEIQQKLNYLRKKEQKENHA